MAEATHASAAEKSPATDLRRRSDALTSAVMDKVLAAQKAPDKHMRLFAEGLSEITNRLCTLECATRQVAYNLQRWMIFDPLRRERQLNHHMHSRQIQGQLICGPVDHLPLIAVCHPETWLAPVHAQGIVIDERLALFPGPLSMRGLPTAWLCSDPDLVMMFCDLWEETKRQSIPIHDVPGLVRLSERQIDIAALLSRGVKDATIARLLGVSPRTVASDLGRLLDAFGVSTRWEAGMVIGRACPPGIVGKHSAGTRRSRM